MQEKHEASEDKSVNDRSAGLGASSTKGFGVGTMTASKTIAVAVCMFGVFGGGPAQAQNDDVETAGDILQFVLPLSALGATIVADDPEGRTQFGKSFLTQFAVVQGLKFAVGKSRPASNSRDSFPSGHTAAAFSGAAFLGSRYGWIAGVPAYAAAIFTGYSRIDADKHFVDDVLAGAGIAILSNYAFATPYREKVAIAPAKIGDGLGVVVRIDNPWGPATSDPKPVSFGNSWFNFEMEFGPAFLIQNTIMSPSSGGAKFNLDNFEKFDDPTTTASAILRFKLYDRQELYISFTPFESRDQGQFRTPVNFNGTIFPANTQIRSAYRLSDFRARYDYKLIDAGGWEARLGGGLLAQYTDVEIEVAGTPTQNSVSEFAALPLAHGSVSYEVTDGVSLFAEASGFALSSDYFVDAGGGVRVKIGNSWDAKASYFYSERRIKSDKLVNEYAYEGVFLSVGHAF